MSSLTAHRPLAGLVVVLLLVGAGCGGETSPSPTSSASASTTAGPTGTASPSASATASGASSPSSAPTATPAPSTPVPTGAWQQLDDFPIGDAFLVADVVVTETGFIAIGAAPAAGQDADGVRQGIVWTSADGLAWQRTADRAFTGATLLDAVNLDGVVYVFGHVSQCPVFDDECPDQGDAGTEVWRSTDGAAWQALPRSASLRAGLIDGCAAAAGRLACFGSTGEEVVATLWISDDGTSWQASTSLAGMDPISALADAGPGMVAFGTQYDLDNDTVATIAGTSADGQVFEPASVPTDAAVTIADLSEGPAGLLAVGSRDDPAAGGAPLGIVFRSESGLDWSGGPEPAFAGVRLEQLERLADGYLVIGSVPAEAGEVSAPTAAWSSADGVSWLSLGVLGDAPVSEITGVASTLGGVVVFGVELDEDISQPGTVHAWFAPLPLPLP
jgi:hypothetical protein